MKFYLTVVGLSFLGLTSCQLSIKGKYQPLGQMFIPKSVQMPLMDNHMLRANEVQNSGYVFGMPLDVNIDMLKECDWNENSETRVCRLEIVSKTAQSLSVQFKRFYLPSKAEFYVVGSQNTLGAFIAENNNRDHMEFAVEPLQGESIILEYIEPIGLTEKPILEIDTVVHGYKPTLDSGKCNVDVACKAAKAWKKQVDSVAVMITDRGSKYCSGAMIHELNHHTRQLFLTANHCVGRDNSRRHLIGFHYESDTCGGPHPFKRPMKTVQGLKLLAKWDPSDFALFEVEEQIPCEWEVFYSGWNIQKTPLFEKAVGIHHPSTDVKKISFFNGTLEHGCWGSYCSSPDHWKIPKWTLGTTEPGSSGSPLFNSKKQIIGQLHGGSASCQNVNGYDVYGAFFASWTGGNTNTTSLQFHLDPRQTNKTEHHGSYGCHLSQQEFFFDAAYLK